MNTLPLFKKCLMGASLALFLSGAATAGELTKVDNITSYNYLTIKEGFPLAKDMAKMHDERQLNRAVELYQWALPLNTGYSMRDSHLKTANADYLDIVYIGNFADHRILVPTLNNETMYATVQFDLSDGPVVYEQPIMDRQGYLFGSIFNAWQVALTDLGVPQFAPDNGKGGKYLILPPGYKGEIPKGYHVFQSTTYVGTIGVRSVMTNGGNLKTAKARIKKMKVYPLDNPNRQQNYIDIFEEGVDSQVAKDVRAYRQMHEYVNEEPIQAQDVYMIGMLKSLGIEKGKPFPTDPLTLKLFEKAADIGWMLSKRNFMESWPQAPFKGSDWKEVGSQATWSHDYMDEGVLNLNRRAAYFTMACIPPVNVGGATYYALNTFDRDRQVMDGNHNYSINLPANVPAKSFWSFILYDAETAAMIDTPKKKYAISSLNKELQYNADGSIDIYFGPKAPKGKEANWIPTNPERDFWTGFRIYGPDNTRLGSEWTIKNPVRLD